MTIQSSQSRPGQFAAAIKSADTRTRYAAALQPPGLTEQAAEAEKQQTAETLAKLTGHDVPADRDS